MRASRFYGGILLVIISVVLFLLESADVTSTAIAFGVIGLALVATSKHHRGTAR